VGARKVAAVEGAGAELVQALGGEISLAAAEVGELVVFLALEAVLEVADGLAVADEN
jgi:hypothetical protein